MSTDSNAPVVNDTQKAQEHNFAQIRKQLEEANRGRQAAEERASQLEQAQAKRTYQDDDQDDGEPYVDHKKLNKKLAQFEQTFEKKVDQMAETKARTMIEQERQASFLKANPDFQQILSPEMLQKFVEKHPEMAEPMLEMPDNFARQKLLYQNIKALGLNKPEVKGPSIQETIDKNRKSPYFQPSGPGAPPYAGGGDFSQSGQKNAYAKMKELIANRRG